eukprot:scaffold65035_cov67-Cyclotella_meneghiniana.AAC.1
MKVACLAYGWIRGVHLVGVTAAEMNMEVVAGNEGLGVCVGVVAVAVWDRTVEAMEVDDMIVYAVGLARRLAAVSKTLSGGLFMEIACASRRWCGSGRMEKAWANLARFCW